MEAVSAGFSVEMGRRHLAGERNQALTLKVSVAGNAPQKTRKE